MSDENKELLSNTLALNLALQTIKERCVHLQKRLFALESENSRLRLNTLNISKRDESHVDNSLSEIEELRAKNAELSLQKSQLTDNLTMISTENRKLWKRLSQLTKDGDDDPTTEATKAHGSQNLIRSKTFTQNSPHQLLKEKLVGHQFGPDEDDLEDISLINDFGFSTDKMTFGQDDNEACDVDSKLCNDGMLSIKKELMKQNSDLKVALSNWRKMKSEFSSGSFPTSHDFVFLGTEVCNCKKGESSDKKPVMVDKNLETDRDLLTLEYELDPLGSPHNNFEIGKHENVLIDLIEQKRAADLTDKARKLPPIDERLFNSSLFLGLPDVQQVLHAKHFV